MTSWDDSKITQRQARLVQEETCAVNETRKCVAKETTSSATNGTNATQGNCAAKEDKSNVIS
jgi:hypothetical protein